MKKILTILLGIILIFGVTILPKFQTQKAQATFNPKVTLCHKQTWPHITIEVALAAVPAHLAHGDSLGACPKPSPTPTNTPTPTFTPAPTIDPCLQPVLWEVWTEEEYPCVTVTPTQEPTPTATPTAELTPTPTKELKGAGNPPTFAGSSTDAPHCPEGQTVNVVANPHVLRSGADATVNFFITEGDSAHIYWSVVGHPHWENAVANIKPNSDNFVSYTIHDLDPNLGYDFGIQQVHGCGGGTTTAVVVDGPLTQLFQFSYWE